VEEGQALNEELAATTDELQLALRRAEESEARSRALLDSAAEGIYGIDEEGRCTFANPAAERLLGYGRGELVGRLMHELVHHTRANGTPYPAHECPIGHAARGGGSVRLEDERLWRGDGTSFPAEYAASPLEGGGGAVVTFLDVSARRAAERERTRLAAVVHAASDYVGLATPDGRGVYVNPAGRRMVGLDAKEDVRRRSITEHFFPEDLPFVRGTILPQTVRDGRWRGEFRFRHFRTGEAVPVLYESFRITDPDTEELIALATVTRDLTERERLLREAQQARGDAERANQAKSQFLANMSHEIRTPINAVMGYADLLDAGVAGELTPQQEEYLGRIRRSSQHLLGLVNDVLDLAKIEAGEMTVREEEGSAVSVMGAALQLVGPQAAARGVELAPAEGCGPRARFRGDEDRVRQIVVNLLSNAVKFTEAGGRVAVRCEVRMEAGAALEGGPWLAVEVEDTGVGIAPEQLERVFAPFVQVEEGHTRTRGGTGLGLTISRSLARMMGGDLTVRSSLGRGSCFTLWLPAVERRGAARTPGAAEEWPASVQDLPELGRVGRAVADGADRVEEALRARLRGDPGLPVARALDDGVLGNHTGPFVAALGKMLEALAGHAASPEDRADSEAILELIATRHGRQRRRLGWPRDALEREYGHLRELLDEIAAGAEGVPGVLHRLLRRAEAASLAAWGHPESGDRTQG
jgi:PAS domain S-box-containing protein